MLSFYGNEHFCPLSLLRVLGASMIEVFEESQLMSQGGGAGGAGGNGHAPTILPSEGFGEGQWEGGKEGGGEEREGREKLHK